nr:hypothetical protein [Tanacetum cinerariifolium]
TGQSVCGQRQRESKRENDCTLLSLLPKFSTSKISGVPGIRVKSIKINGKSDKLHKSLLSINNKGVGGTAINAADPYTILETSIYNAFIAAFVKAMPKNVQRVPDVAPFGGAKGHMCLGFIEAPNEQRFRPRASIVIGGHQIDDNLLQSDLSASRLGLSSSLLTRSTTCAKFDFTLTA